MSFRNGNFVVACLKVLLFIAIILSLIILLNNDWFPNQFHDGDPTNGFHDTTTANYDEAEVTFKMNLEEQLMKSIGIVQEQNAKFQFKKVIDDNVNDQHLLDYIRSPARLTPFNFDDCRMYNCFDFSRCQSAGPMKVHIVGSSRSDNNYKNEATTTAKLNLTSGESNIIHKNILSIIKQSEHYEPDPKKACLFVLEDDTLDRDPLSPSFRKDLSNIINPENFYGLNHLIFNLYSGTWPDYRENDFAGLQFGAAILAKASNSFEHHRTDFDISLPLFSYQHPYANSSHQDEELDLALINQNRSFFLTFKGKRYVIGNGSETRNGLYHLNNQRDVILLTTCRHGKKWREVSDNRCLEDDSNYDQYDFVDLMKESIFCLVPRGRRLGSFRFLEAMSYGCIPVIMSDGWVKPFDEIVDWSEATIQFQENLILLVPDMLRDIDKQTINRLRGNCGTLYRKYFSTVKKIILTTLSIIEQRIQNHIIRQQASSGKVSSLV